MDLITSKAVLGYMKQALSEARPIDWVGQVANVFSSNQATEQYPFLSATPGLREWVGGRNASGFTENGISITNKLFEGTVDVKESDMRRDKFGMIKASIDELVINAMNHPADLLTQLIIAGESATCYDGQYFFDTDHPGYSGNQSNDISVDISALATAVHGTTTIPGVEEVQLAVMSGIVQLMGLKNDQGMPMNQTASSFIVMVPPGLYSAALTAVDTKEQVGESQTALTAMKRKFSIEVVFNPMLTWTDKVALFRTDGAIKPLIFQRETNINVGALAEGSDYTFKYKRHQYGVDYEGNVAYGLWQRACLVTLA